MNATFIHSLARAVAVDDVAHVVDQLDDLLRHPVSWRGLAGKDVGPRHDRRPAVFDQRQVLVDDVHHVEQLPLVGVDPLDLNIEQRIGVDFNAAWSPE